MNAKQIVPHIPQDDFHSDDAFEAGLAAASQSETDRNQEDQDNLEDLNTVKNVNIENSRVLGITSKESRYSDIHGSLGSLGCGPIEYSAKVTALKFHGDGERNRKLFELARRLVGIEAKPSDETKQKAIKLWFSHSPAKFLGEFSEEDCLIELEDRIDKVRKPFDFFNAIIASRAYSDLAFPGLTGRRLEIAKICVSLQLNAISKEKENAAKEGRNPNPLPTFILPVENTGAAIGIGWTTMASYRRWLEKNWLIRKVKDGRFVDNEADEFIMTSMPRPEFLLSDCPIPF